MSEPIFSPGLEGVIAGETTVSSIVDGLSYRGYSIEDLGTHSTFEEVAYLLIHGDLPKKEQAAAFRQRLGAAATSVSPQIIETLRGMPPNTQMMDIMRTGASMLAHWDPDTDLMDHDANVRKAERLVGQLPVILAAGYRLQQKQEPVAADKNRSLAGNLLWMLTGKAPAPRAEQAMDVSLILYAEHEFNASTFTARVVASTLSDLHSAVTSAIGALKGPLHGGANEHVLEVLESIGSADRAEAWIRDALAHKKKIMGFGHRVYKNGDPRARFLTTLCRELASETRHEDLERMSATIERIMHEERPKLPPNLDWPSARLYRYLDLDVQLYTPLFVVSRVTGWSAHIIEQLDHNRIIRPVSRYSGQPARPWQPVEKR